MSDPQAFGPYRVLRLLGAGGMGRVYEVASEALPGRRLALKLTLQDQASQAARRRFAREAELLGRVRHPGVVAVHACGESPEGPWLVMDLVEGCSLDEQRRSGPLEPRRAAELVAAMADAMEAVHAAGVLHRDLKPGNVILRPDGTPVVIDFGLARAGDATPLTATGTVMGSPQYMPPEQANGTSSRELDARADVYGLGALLFALLSGRPPFVGSSLPATLRKVLAERPAWPAEARRAVPRGLRAIVERALEKRPEDRWPSARALEQALRAWLRGEAPRRRARAAGLLLGLGAVAAVSAGLLRQPGGAAPQPAPSPWRADPAAGASGATPSPASPTTPPAAPGGPWQRAHPDADEDPGGREVRVLALGGTPPRFLSCLGLCYWRLPERRRERSSLALWTIDPRAGPSYDERWELPGVVEELCADDRGGAWAMVCGAGARRLLALEPGREPRTVELALPQLDRLVSALARDPAGRWLALASTPPPGQTRTRVALHALDARGEPAREPAHELLDPEEGVVTGLGFLPDGRLATCGGDAPGEARNSVTVWALDGPGPVEVERLRTTNRYTALAVDPRGELWLGNTYWQIQRVTDLRADRLEAQALVGHGARSQLGVGGRPGSHDGQVVALRFLDERLWSLSSEQLKGGNEVRAWRRDATGSWTNTGGVLEWRGPVPVALDVTPDGEWLLIGTDRGTIEVWPAGPASAGFRARREVAPR